MKPVELMPPIGGISRKRSHVDSAKFPTSEYMNNVRSIDVEKRIRICQRPAVVKWGAGTQIGGADQPVVCICSVSSVY